jgi:hypothetical protein
MNRMLTGFQDELVKVSSLAPAGIRSADLEARHEMGQTPHDNAFDKMRGQGRQVSRDYLSSMIIGTLAAPVVAMLGKKIGRMFENHALQRALHATRDAGERRSIMDEIHVGKIFGHAKPGMALNARPLMTPSDAIASASQGLIMSSVVQLLRDRLAGGAAKKPKLQR